MGRLMIQFLKYTAMGLFLLIISCPSPLEDKLTETITAEVKEATASEYKLTVETPENGIVSLSGTITVKDDIAQQIVASPYQTHAFMIWEKVSGAGTVVFNSPASAETSFLVTGGDAVIRAVFEERPRVRYSTPTGTDVGIDASVLIKFSREMDANSINENTITLVKSDNEEPVSGIISYDNKMVTFKPNSDMDSWTKFSIKVSRDVKDLNGITLSEDYITPSPFETRATGDTKPPIEGVFQINSGQTWTSSLNLTLTDIFARDLDGGSIAKMYVSEDGVNWSDPVTYNDTMNWTYSGSDGVDNSIFMKFEDASGNINHKVSISGSGPYIPDGDDIESTISIDTTAPSSSEQVQSSGENGIAIDVVDAVDGDNDPTGDMYTASQDVNIYVNTSDAGIGTSGTGGEETLQMILAQDLSFTQGEWNGSSYDTAFWEDFSDDTTVRPFTVDPGDGTKIVLVKFRDSLGNESGKTYDYVKLDQTPPSGSISIENGIAYTKEASVTLNISAVDNGVDSGNISNAEMFISSDSAFSSGSWESYSTTKTWPIDNSTNGEKTVYIKFRDSLGNEMDNAEGEADTIIVDIIPPAANGFSINGGAAEAGTNLVDLTISATDSSSGAAEMMISNLSDFTGVSWISYNTSYENWDITDGASGDGTKTVYIKYKDTAGNEMLSSNADSDTITLDTTPPDGTFNIDSGASYTNDTNRYVDINMYLSSPDGAEYRIANTTALLSSASYTSYGSANNKTVSNWVLEAGEGTKTVYVQFKSSAGVEGTPVSDTIILDVTPPEVGTCYLEGTADDNSTTRYSYVTINSSVSGSPAFMRFKNESGGTWSGWYAYNTVKTAWYLYNYNSDGLKRVYFQYKDAAGNVTDGADNDTIKIDKTAPSVSYFRIGGADNPAKTKETTVTLYSSVSDANEVYQMRIGNYPGPFNEYENYTATRTDWPLLTPDTDGQKKIYCYYRDKAGNTTSTLLNDTIELDTTPPQNVSVLINEGRTYAYDQSVTLAISADDVPSGSLMRFRYLQGSVYSWTAYENFNTSKTITLSDSDATKYVYVQVKDDIGNESGLYDHRDSIILDRPSINYVTRGTPGGNGKVKVYLNTVYENTAAGEDVMYRIYTSTTPGGTKSYRGYIYNSGDEIAPPSEETEYYFHVKIGHKYDAAWHYLSTYYTGIGGADKTGYAADVIIVYDDGDSTDLALANLVKTTLQTNYPSTYTWASGTQPTWSVMVIPDTDISDTYSSSNIIYGKPVIITPGLYNSYSSSGKDGWARNIAQADQGIITMGAGAWLLDRIEVNWSAWGLPDQAPTDIGYGESGSMSGTNGRYTKIANNYCFRYPLQSTNMGSSPATGSSQQFYSNDTDGAGFAVYRSGGANPAGGYNYSQVYNGSDYYPFVRQGRFLYWGWSKFPYYYYTGRLAFINAVAYMDGY